MDHAVTPQRARFAGPVEVPGSKSIWQRALVLGALAAEPPVLEAALGSPPAEDVCHLDAALGRLGRYVDGTLGVDRDRQTLDLGLGATGFRFAVAAAALRPAGARTLVTGRPALRARPHGPLLRSLERLGARIKRRHSGAVRIVAKEITAGRVDVDTRASSQFASALMLIAPRVGGLTIRLPEPPVSRAYLHVTADVLRAFGVDVTMPRDFGVRGSEIHVSAGVPRVEKMVIEPDASAAAAWWTAAALTGGRVIVPGLGRGSIQADTALLEILTRAGAAVEEAAAGAEVTGCDALRGLGTVDLRDSPDLLPLVAILAARAEGETVLRGVAHARGKESDRIATVCAALRALGGDVIPRPDGMTIRGGPLHGGVVDASGDHRIAFAFGVLGLVVPGVRLRGAQATAKSDPAFLARLAAFAGGAGD